MAYKVNDVLVINDDAAVVHESFPQISGTTQSTAVKILASDGDTNDRFGWAISVGSGRIVVGAHFNDDNGSNSGSAYIFDFDGNELVKILPSDGAGNDYFGDSLAVGSGRIVVGAPGEDENGSSSGSAYIFDLDGTQLAKITASDGSNYDEFGRSAAAGSGRIVVGSPQNADDGSNSGSAYIFDLDGNELAKITASDAAAGDYFGNSVAVGSGRIVVGAHLDADNGIDSGSAYIFDLDGNQLAKILPSDGAAGDYFGNSVAVGSGRIVVGAHLNTDNGIVSGSAYIFDLDGNELAKITASDAADNDIFGEFVAVGSGRIVVTARRDDDYGADSGSVYIFDLNGNQLEKIFPTTPSGGLYFASSVAVGSGKIVAGVNSDNNGTIQTGAAYVYSLSEDHNTYWERILNTYKY